MLLMTDNEIRFKADKHVNKHNGGGWRLLDIHPNRTVSIIWFKGERQYIKLLI